MRKKILLFDDDIACLDILEIVSQDCGYDTFAFSTWKSNSIDEIIKINPDVIFLDEWFHGMRGNEICTILRSINQLKKTQIFLISAVMGLKDIALKCSADGYVEKPFSLSDIENILLS